jgi:hypothetical protein
MGSPIEPANNRSDGVKQRFRREAQRQLRLRPARPDLKCMYVLAEDKNVDLIRIFTFAA